jgi:hypothetical protein
MVNGGYQNRPDRKWGGALPLHTRGSAHPQAKLTEAQIAQIRAEDGVTPGGGLAKRYGVSRARSRWCRTGAPGPRSTTQGRSSRASDRPRRACAPAGPSAAAAASRSARSRRVSSRALGSTPSAGGRPRWPGARRSTCPASYVAARCRASPWRSPRRSTASPAARGAASRRTRPECGGSVDQPEQRRTTARALQATAQPFPGAAAEGQAEELPGGAQVAPAAGPARRIPGDRGPRPRPNASGEDTRYLPIPARRRARVSRQPPASAAQDVHRRQFATLQQRQRFSIASHPARCVQPLLTPDASIPIWRVAPKPRRCGSPWASMHPRTNADFQPSASQISWRSARPGTCEDRPRTARAPRRGQAAWWNARTWSAT